jgi:EAL and modified HD-GYP domain-containing signal transduction protein
MSVYPVAESSLPLPAREETAGRAVFIARQAIVDRKQQVFGYELLARADAMSETAPQTHTLGSDAQFLFNALSDFGGEQLFGQRLAFVNCVPEVLGGEHLEIVFPERLTLELPRVAGDVAGQIAGIATQMADLRARGFHLAAGPYAAGSAYSAWLPHLQFIKLDVQTANPAMARYLAHLAGKQPGLRLVAEKIETAEQWQTYAELGFDYFQGFFFARPQTVTARVVSPAFSNVLRLLDLAAREAALPELEAVIRRDPSLSFKLLRYINSSGFGLMSEITSFRHAVTLLGYRKLFRWLTLLLATLDKSAAPPVVVRMALTRGRMMELLSTGVLSPEESDHAFITGVFSLLDRLLGVSMETALDSLMLPSTVEDALLHRQGTLGPFLQIVEACEREAQAHLATNALLLGLDARRVSAAHLEALGWAERLEL